MRKRYWLLIIFLILLVILLGIILVWFGLSYWYMTSDKGLHKNEPEFISSPIIEKNEKGEYILSFKLSKRDGTSVEVGGEVIFVLEDLNGNRLFEKQYLVDKNKFSFGSNILTQGVISRYEIELPKSEIDSISNPTIVAKIKFKSALLTEFEWIESRIELNSLKQETNLGY